MSFLSWESVFMAESLQQVTAEWESSDDDATPITMRSCLSSVCRADGPRAVGVCRTSSQGIPDHGAALGRSAEPQSARPSERLGMPEGRRSYRWPARSIIACHRSRFACQRSFSTGEAISATLAFIFANDALAAAISALPNAPSRATKDRKSV